MPWGPHSHVFPSWGPLDSLFFILGGFSSPIKSHILSSHGSSGGTERLPAFCGGSGLRENETEATRCGDAEPETRVSIASPAVNHSTSKGHPTLEGRGHGLPLRAEGETVTFPKGVRTGQDLGDRLCEQDSREPQIYVPGTTPSTPGVGVGDARALPMPSASSKDRLHPSQRQG